MNTARIKAYAIQARRDFIKAVTERANAYGIFSDDHIEPMLVKGDTAIIGERAFPRKEGDLREKLVSRLKKDGFDMVVRASAYTWFNRFVALRYMELHDYLDHGYRVLSSRDGSGMPEIIEYAAEVGLPGIDRQQVIELKLAGTRDNELYRLLLLAQCDVLHRSMPFLFDRIDSETALLLPDNLLFSGSPLRKMVTEIDASDWNEVEIIGWIYQFYISERKDQVIGKVVKSEDIPAATQLFTPNWIVKYMLHNTLGRMWLATYPESALKDKMAYYIAPGEQTPEVQEQLDAITPRELDPETITLLDPACGSGHILVEAYDIFKEIYRERGYRTREIPRLILEKNLYGLDIDGRAAQLAGFTVLMKARADDHRIFKSEDLRLNVHAIQESKPSDLRIIDLFFKADEYDGLRSDLKELTGLFESSKTFGSLIAIPPQLVPKIFAIVKAVEEKIGKWVSKSDVQNVRALVQQAAILARQYDCVVTNPPYMGGKGLSPKLKSFAKDNFSNSKSDLFAMFIERNLDLLVKQGLAGMVTMQSWMFLSSFEKLREKLINCSTLLSMAHLGARAFDSIGGEVVSTSTFVMSNSHHSDYKGAYIRLIDQKSEAEKEEKLRTCISESNFHLASTVDFKKIPGSPIAYWISENLKKIFLNNHVLEKFGDARIGLQTGDNARFLREWFEVNFQKIGFYYESRDDVLKKGRKWFPYNKGGGFRKWFGNQSLVVNWEHDGKEIIEYQTYLNSIKPASSKMGIANNSEFYFKPSLSWSKVSAGEISFRYFPKGFIFDVAGTSFFPKKFLFTFLGLLNSKIIPLIVSVLSPTMNYEAGAIRNIPIVNYEKLSISTNVKCLVDISKKNWGEYEISWYYKIFPLLISELRCSSLKISYATHRAHWHNLAIEMQRLEEENNLIFIEAYGLRDELTPDVPLSEITLTCNPHYRYNGNKEEAELETLLLTDTIKELISYAVGCMMGRYSLDEPGLIYAHSGNDGFDPSRYKSFPADDDGIIPIMDLEWFPDDAANRFIEFMQIAWPPETFDENLEFVAGCLKPRSNETSIDTIRRYFSTGFFKDHLKTYKKRPIYWLFSSGRHKAFECLVYLHRYNESTLSRMRSTYVTPLQGNFSARLEFLQQEKDAAPTASAQKKFQKEMDTLKKKQTELAKFDDALRHYADMKIPLDLDDGVKVNYGKFGDLLAEKKAVTGKN